MGIVGTIGGIALVIFLTQTIFAPIIGWMEWFPDHGFVGILAYLLLYIVLALLVAPASFHKFVSGLLFGFWAGWAIAFVGACLGGILPFWITRKYLYEWMDGKLESKPMLKALKQAVGNDGVRCVLLTRMSLVIPYPFLNYGYGLTDVTWKDYLIGNTGMIVPGALYAWWGSQANDIAAAMNETRDWTYWVAIGASMILTVWIIYYLRKITLAHIEASSEHPAGMVQEP